MRKNQKQSQCSVNERNGQLVFALNNEILLPENAPVRLTSAQLEELDYRKLYRAYSAKGRKSKVDPRVLFKVKLDELRCRWEEYEKSLEIMGPSRNSYSKTDPDATFMRMKEDHMRNGQLKPAYNVQIAVNSEYITGIETFSDRTDLGTMIPFLEELKRQHKGKYAEVTADAGYESLDNYLYLEKNGQMSFIKPSNYEVRKTKRFKEQVGRIENMTYDEQWDAFICAYGKTLSLRRETTELVQGRPVTTSWYRCEDCTNCPHRSACCQAKDLAKPKEVVRKKTFWEMRTAENASF